MNKRIIFFVLGLGLIGVATAQTSGTEKFSVIAMGDMPYVLPADFIRFENLIRAVNSDKPAFSVHVGDIKSSNTPCTEAYYEKIIGYLGEFESPLIYTPGDNEWTDCNKVAAGSYDPEERLEVVRKLFFKDNTSFGKTKITTLPQSESAGFSKFVENRTWDFNGIVFGTVHLVGTNNFFLPTSKNHNSEFFERDKANVAWLAEIFNHAKKVNSAGIFIFTQADMFSEDKAASGCFNRFLRELKILTTDFKEPVVLVHGDSHKFIVDKPFLQEDSKRVLENFTRIQVFGEQDIQAVKIIINTGSKSLFQVEQFLVSGN
jgi:hypothetical protein